MWREKKTQGKHDKKIEVFIDLLKYVYFMRWIAHTYPECERIDSQITLPGQSSGGSHFKVFNLLHYVKSFLGGEWKQKK